MSFSQDFKNLQRLERALTGSIIFFAVIAPVSFSWLLKKELHWSLSAILAMVILASAICIHITRQRVSARLIKHYQDLEIGAVLQKKMTAQKEMHRFVIINTEREHFHLQCLCSGRPMLVSKSRVREYFDIEN